MRELELEETTLSGSGADPDGDQVTLDWSGCAAGSGLSSTCSVGQPGNHSATLTVTDPWGASKSASVSSSGTNAAPTVSFSPSSAGGAAAGYVREISEHGLPSFSVYTHSQPEAGRPDPGWLLVVLHDPEVVFGAVKGEIRTFHLVLGTVTLGLLLLAVFVSGSIARPIQEITLAISKLPPESAGEKISIRAPGEIGLLVRTLNERADRIARSKEELQETNDRYRIILHTALDGFWLVDIEGRLLDINEAYCLMSGYSAKELLSMRVTDLEVTETRKEEAAAIEKLMTRSANRFVSRHRGKGGRLFYVEVSVQDRPSGAGSLVCFLRDITARKLAEEEKAKLEAQLLQSQKMEAVGQLAGGIAHDFNNILAAMIMQLEMLRLEPSVAPDELTEAANELLESANRAANLTRQLLLFSRRQVMKSGLHDANGLLRELTKLMRRLIGERVTVVLALSDEPLWFDGDAGMIEQVVTNLCVNARDSMPQGGQLTIATRSVVIDDETARRHGVAAGRFVCVEVSDTGSGIEPSVLEHVFEPFFTTKGVGKGTGLGLATVHGIVAKHLGFVEVTSQQGKGSTFRVHLPGVPAPSASEPTRAPIDVRGGSERILVVEDEPAVRRMAVRCLRQVGYHVAEAANGVEALRVWEQEAGRFDLLFTDMVMPEGLSGLDLCARLRQLRPGLPTIITSGHSSDIVEDENVALHEVAFLSKPYHTAAVAAMVRECLEKKR